MPTPQSPKAPATENISWIVQEFDWYVKMESAMIETSGTRTVGIHSVNSFSSGPRKESKMEKKKNIQPIISLVSESVVIRKKLNKR